MTEKGIKKQQAMKDGEVLQIGDRVYLKGYVNLVEVDGIDDYLTNMLDKTHYTGVDVKYLEGKRKVNNCDPFTIEDVDQKLKNYD